MAVRWSKVKQAMELRLADSLQGRVAFYAARYHEAHDGEGRGWITFDGEEIASFCTMTAWNQEYELGRTGEHGSRPGDHKGVVAARRAQGFYTLPEFQNALRGCLNMSIEAALESEDTLTRALAMLDRRLGKRRLRALDFAAASHPIVKLFYEMRLTAECMRLPNS